MIDIANHVIAREGLGVPRAYSETMEILVRAAVLPEEHEPAFLAMVRFRNRVVHLYDGVDVHELSPEPARRLPTREGRSVATHPEPGPVPSRPPPDPGFVSRLARGIQDQDSGGRPGRVAPISRSASGPGSGHGPRGSGPGVRAPASGHGRPGRPCQFGLGGGVATCRGRRCARLPAECSGARMPACLWRGVRRPAGVASDDSLDAHGAAGLGEPGVEGGEREVASAGQLEVGGVVG